VRPEAGTGIKPQKAAKEEGEKLEWWD